MNWKWRNDNLVWYHWPGYWFPAWQPSQSFTSGLSSGNGLPNFRTNPLFEIAHLEGVGIIEIQNKVEASNSPRYAAVYEFVCLAHVCIGKLFWHKDRQVQLSREHRSTVAFEIPPEDCGIDSLRVACLLERVASHETLLLRSYVLIRQCQLKKAKTLHESLPDRESHFSFVALFRQVHFYFSLSSVFLKDFRELCIGFHLHLTMSKTSSLKAMSVIEVSFPISWLQLTAGIGLQISGV